MQDFYKNKEKGAIIVFFAFLIPLIMLSFALAIDLGNLYSHKARLQNAADAAALAGARRFAQSNDADFRARLGILTADTVASHPNADEEAEKYADENAEKNNLKNNIEFLGRAKEDPDHDGIVYYRVDLSETVPLYFLRVIPGLTEQEVKANSMAAIGGSVAYKRTPGDELFIFKHNFDAVNTVNNPDNITTAGQISTAFEGNIVYTDGVYPNGDTAHMPDTLKYSTQAAGLNKFFTPLARDNNVTIEEAVKDLDPVTGKNKYCFESYYQEYDMDELARSTRERMGLPDYSARTWENWDIYKQKFGQVSEGYKNITSSMLSQDLAITANMGNGDGNTHVSLDSTVPGSSSDPVYLYIDESVNQRLNIDVTADNGRPVIIVYTGTSEVAFNISSGTTFSGVIYAPNASQVLVNAGGGNFQGTMIADNLTLRGDGATYKYVDYGVGSKSGQESKDVTIAGTSSVRLVSSNNVTW